MSPNYTCTCVIDQHILKVSAGHINKLFISEGIVRKDLLYFVLAFSSDYDSVVL